MARPKAFDVEQTLEKASECFQRLGYSGASVADLLDAMGLNRASMYSTYGTKEELFEKVLDLYSSQEAEKRLALDSQQIIAREKLRFFLSRSYAEKKGQMVGDLVLTALNEYAIFQPIVQEKLHSYLTAVKAQITHWVTRELARVGRRPEDAPVISLQIMGAWVTLLTLGRGGVAQEELDILLETHLHALDVTTSAPRLVLHVNTSAEIAAMAAIDDEETEVEAKLKAMTAQQRRQWKWRRRFKLEAFRELGVFRYMLGEDEL